MNYGTDIYRQIGVYTAAAKAALPYGRTLVKGGKQRKNDTICLAELSGNSVQKNGTPSPAIASFSASVSRRIIAIRASMMFPASSMSPR
jgi:hypothetical protein